MDRAVGIKRIDLARTPGFDDPAMTLETLAERREDIFAGTARGLWKHDEADPRV